MNNERAASRSLLKAVKEAQSYLSVAYLLMVGIGMLFEYQRYHAFGINVFQFADVFDFLIAPFRDIAIFGLTVLSLAVVSILFKWDRYLQQHKPALYHRLSFGQFRKPWFGLMHQALFCVLFIFYLYLSSQDIAKDHKRRIMQPDHTIGLRLDDGRTRYIQLIGMTKDMVFAYHNNSVAIIPLSSVKEFTYVKSQ